MMQSKQHPIIYSTAKVQAILADRKSQMRCIVKDSVPIGNWDITVKHCPYGQVGDILYVRETWRKYCFVDSMGYTHFDQEIIEYAADNPGRIYLVDGDGARMYNKDGSEKYVPWRPSIHMPKSACRLYLQITDIRVERLNEISEEDAKAEGVETLGLYPGYDVSARGKFEGLWNSINGPDSWDSNPFVWVISFKKIDKPS